MKQLKIRRCIAYLIDILIITVIITLLGKIRFLNPNYEKLAEVSNEYNEYYETYLSGSTITLDDTFVDLFYRISYYQVSNTIIKLVVIILYFTLFPFFFKGQTIGKRIMKLKIESNKEKLSIFQLLFRSLIIPIMSSLIFYTSSYDIISVILVLILKKQVFYNTISIVSILFCLYGYIDLLFIFVRKDEKSLHELITKTEVKEISE